MKLAKYLMIAATSLGLLLGCNDKLDLEPSDSLTSGTAITDMDGLRAALTGAFDGMQSVNYYGRNYILIPELGADNVYLSKVNSNRFLSSYRREYTVLDSDVSGFWNTAYNVILRANNLIANVDNVPGDETEKNVAKGQALFIRALVHFDLTRIFAKPYNQGAGAQPGVPLILKFEVATPARAPLSEVYAQIIKDLTEAKGLLASTTIEEKLKPSKYAAAALLARVYLYQGNNAAAITEATEVINAGYTLTPAASFAGYFADPGAAEDIFTLHFPEVETLGSDNIGNMYLKPGYGDVRVSPDLRSIYDDADVRKN
ncbi:RagB/SusD family nutrient uptake outer membrane protein [Chitinophaga sedimenti]|uniref:RagB/SusD family nutrient uptake outer membrane protein n=1 Tax=Chitinophaga sedimenti TaxID=2033606 RepID=UPI00200582AB|nr:RagB/SusD family nutrient uptake outer membrane protein [Chitinophaga sedimenti]MCK7558957.1 RagB/SusD family nutrient uptake outer membrane protein [Chitinophaga sedimenti]